MSPLFKTINKSIASIHQEATAFYKKKSWWENKR